MVPQSVVNMLYEILSECISIIGTLIAVLAVRYLMELSTPMDDMLTIERFLIGEAYRWHSGTFESLVIRYRVKRLLDYE